MIHLAFIRSSTCYDCWDYYECKTDVWVFGDVGGYQYLRQEIFKASKATDNIYLTILDKHSTSMRGVILPAKKIKTQKPRLKFIERFVSDESGTNMELVIYGNLAGYQYLAETIETLIKKYAGNPSEHIHLDDQSDPYIIARSVSLNLRGPLHKWRKQNMEEYANLVYNKSNYFIPPNLEYRFQEKEEYLAINAKNSEFLKI